MESGTDFEMGVDKECVEMKMLCLKLKLHIRENPTRIDSRNHRE